VLFRLAYLGVTNTLALLRLLPVGDRDKDAERSWHSGTRSRFSNGNCTARESGSPRSIGPCLPPCYTGYPVTYCVACGCWYARRLCCAGTVI
jgi:hypothetical protein